ncbi:MAG: adenosylcobinamide-GDP ribazoletransferase [Shinella sp.]|nr:adenosylcobinamide-GDP ribazoletransferase [Shinella sp.]
MEIRDLIDDVARSVAFLSRLRVPPRYFEDHDGRLSRAVRAFPLAGLVIALPSAALLALLAALGADPLFTAFAVLALQAFVTGGLHEDGLSDTADGLGGGGDREAALAIMKDSRIGSYGAIALVLSFGLRASALAALLPQLAPVAAALAFLAVAAGSRAAMVWHWSFLPPARKDGVAAAAGEPEEGAASLAIASGALVAAVLLLSCAGLLASVLAVLFVAASALGFNRAVAGKLEGHTGDTIGASQQIAEISLFAALALAL